MELSKSLSEDRGMNDNFVQFLEKLEMPNSRRFPIERDYNLRYESGPVYNVVSRCLATWKARKGSKATYKLLLELLESNYLTQAAQIVRTHLDEKYKEKAGGKQTAYLKLFN